MGTRTAGADRKLAHYVRRDVYPYSAYYRAVLDGAGVGSRVRGDGDLARIPPTDLADVRDPAALVLRPDLARIVRSGDRRLAVRAVAAKAGGGMHGFNRRVVEHRFKPVHWVVGDGVPLGYSSADLIHLARHGRAWLERAGVRPTDVLLSFVRPGPTVGHWQLVFGCRRLGTSAIHLDPTVNPDWADRLAPSVLAGDPHHLVAILSRSRAAGHTLANLRTVIALGEPLRAETRTRLQDLAGSAAVVAAWAPAGVRAVWTECRESTGGAGPAGYHAWDDDVLEVVGPPDAPPATGELLWTGIGWQGSAVLRLRTHVTASLERTPCPACGRPGVRIVPLAPLPRGNEPVPAAAPVAVSQGPVADVPAAPDPPPAPPAPAAVLAAEADVAAWQIERRRVNGDRETIVWLAPGWGAAVGPLLRRLDRQVHATQFIVLDADEMAARLLASGGATIIGSETP